MEMRHPVVHHEAGVKQQPVGYSYTSSAYDHFQVIYVTDGELRFHSPHTNQVLTAGMGVVLRMGSVFRLACPDLGYHGVGVNVFEPRASAYHGEANTFTANLAVHELATMIQHEIASPDTGTDQVLDGLGIALCWQTLRLTGASYLLSDTAHDWAERVRQVILANITSGHSVHDVLGTLPLSYRQLARHFSAHFGLSPKQYQQQCRMDEVKRLLRETSVSVTTIAHVFGYPSSQHLCTQFQQSTGLTPLAYRRQPCP